MQSFKILWVAALALSLGACSKIDRIADNLANPAGTSQAQQNQNPNAPADTGATQSTQPANGNTANSGNPRPSVSSTGDDRRPQPGGSVRPNPGSRRPSLPAPRNEATVHAGNQVVTVKFDPQMPKPNFAPIFKFLAEREMAAKGGIVKVKGAPEKDPGHAVEGGIAVGDEAGKTLMNELGWAKGFTYAYKGAAIAGIVAVSAFVGSQVSRLIHRSPRIMSLYINSEADRQFYLANAARLGELAEAGKMAKIMAKLSPEAQASLRAATAVAKADAKAIAGTIVDKAERVFFMKNFSRLPSMLGIMEDGVRATAILNSIPSRAGAFIYYGRYLGAIATAGAGGYFLITSSEKEQDELVGRLATALGPDAQKNGVETPVVVTPKQVLALVQDFFRKEFHNRRQFYAMAAEDELQKLNETTNPFVKAWYSWNYVDIQTRTQIATNRVWEAELTAIEALKKELRAIQTQLQSLPAQMTVAQP